MRRTMRSARVDMMPMCGVRGPLCLGPRLYAGRSSTCRQSHQKASQLGLTKFRQSRLQNRARSTELCYARSIRCLLNDTLSQSIVLSTAIRNGMPP